MKAGSQAQAMTQALEHKPPINPLALPGELTRTAYVPPEGMTFEEWQEAGRTLLQAGTAVQWWIGDWIRYGEREYGEKYSQALEVTAYDYQTLRNMVYVAERVELSRRRDNLSWSHHAEVAPLDLAEQEAWLDAAEENKWSRGELRSRLRASSSAEEPAAADFRLSFVLPRPAVSALRRICDRLQCSDEYAVERALLEYDSRLPEHNG